MVRRPVEQNGLQSYNEILVEGIHGFLNISNKDSHYCYYLYMYIKNKLFYLTRYVIGINITVKNVEKSIV